VSGLLDVDRLYSVGVVVRDLGAATLRYAEIFGIDEWDVRDFGPKRLSDVRVHGRRTAPTFRTATGSTVPPAGDSPMGGASVPVTFELVQALQGESSFQEFRSVRGQGISHLTLAVREPDAFEHLRGELARAGLAVASSMVVDGRMTRHFLDTRAALGGFLVEVQVPLETGPGIGVGLVVDERWNHAGRYTRPTGVGPLTVQGVNHFGVVVDDVMTSLARYNEILGIETWNMRDWRTEPGRLEAPYYRGEPVNHEYFTGRTAFRDFGFEIIQPTLGPSHYNREFRDLWGAGVHHMLLSVTTDEGEWRATQRWLESIDVPLAMGGGLMNGAATFCYFDTFDSLGGYLLEALMITPEVRSGSVQPDYVIDFAALTATL
jgi:catechol 2,3-dioxygenase-like lactoylglutathione lyase family enzyme